MILPVIADWQILEVQPTKSGGKSAAIVGPKCEPVCITFPVLKSPFDASAYNDETASRVNLTLEVSEHDIIEWFAALDSWVLQYCSKNCRRLFGKDYISISELRPLYYSPLKSNEKYGTNLLKLKMNKSGKHSVRIWNKGGLPRDPPECWADLQIQARVVLKSLWLQGSRSFGLTFECTDAMIVGEEPTKSCPFNIDEV